MVQQAIHQRSGPIAGRRMDHKPCRLIEHQEICIFVENLERDRFGFEIKRLGPWNLEPDAIPWFDFLARPDNPAVDLNAAFFDQSL